MNLDKVVERLCPECPICAFEIGMVIDGWHVVSVDREGRRVGLTRDARSHTPSEWRDVPDPEGT